MNIGKVRQAAIQKEDDRLKKKKWSQVSSRGKAWKSISFQFLCKYSCFIFPQLLVIKMTIHRMHLSTQLYLRDIFFSHRNEWLHLNKPLLSSHSRSLKSILIIYNAVAASRLSHPLHWDCLSTRFWHCSPSHSLLFLSLSFPCYNTNHIVPCYCFSVSSTDFWTLKGHVCISSPLCFLCFSIAKELLLIDFTCAGMWLKNHKNEHGFNNRDAIYAQ